MDTFGEQLNDEQHYLDHAFAHLDKQRRRDQELLRTTMLQDDSEPQALVERDIEYHRLQGNLERYRTAEVGLVFGRIDIDDEEPDNPVTGTSRSLDRRYIGRLGLSDENRDYRTIVMDWRAPGARPFYLATTAHPEGVTLRRHLRTRGRKVRAIDDEWLDTAGIEVEHKNGSAEGDLPPNECAEKLSHGVGGESVLRDVLNQARDGHMHGIVETIQREQDFVIRDATRGTMVVQGGPGTGKTAVALHRVAWLLYTYRYQLEKTGVLIIGPNDTFLNYISRVLPSLGETGVVLTTIGDLYPLIKGTAAIESGEQPESLMTQEVKGSLEMVEILTQAVRAYQLVPEEAIGVTLDQIELEITPGMVKTARGRARRTRKPHNLARPIFREELSELLVDQLANIIGTDPLGGDNLLSMADMADLREELDAAEAVAGVLEDLWPKLTPERVLDELLTSRDAIDHAAADYDENTRASLYREPGSPWMPSDAPLLDELAELLGPAQRTSTSVNSRFEEPLNNEDSWETQVSDAQDALDTLSSSASQDLDDGFDAEILMAYDVIDAETLAERHRERDQRTTAERAAADRTWAFGHVIVDEAQELSAMAWRMLRRRSPNGWMTLVGDVAQTGSPAGAETWEGVLEPIIGSRWRLHELTINYRTPAEIMQVAAHVLHEIDSALVAPQSIRKTGRHPVIVPSLVDANAHVAANSDENRLVAVIAPANMLPQVRTEVTELKTTGQLVSQQVQVHDIGSSKGLEFDEVIVVEPDSIVADSPQGLQDLYVALTRATQGLTVVARQQPEHLPMLRLPNSSD